MNTLRIVALVFTVLILLYALRESLKAAREATDDLRKEFSKKKLLSLLRFCTLVLIGIGPFGHYAIETFESFYQHA